MRFLDNIIRLPQYLSPDPRTVFYPHLNIKPGTIAFQAACFPGQYLIFHNKTEMRIGVPENDNELFEEIVVHPGHAYKSYIHSDPQCYLAFDTMGNAHEQELCQVTTGHADVVISYIETSSTSVEDCEPHAVLL